MLAREHDCLVLIHPSPGPWWFRKLLVPRLNLEVYRCNVIAYAVKKLYALLECDVQTSVW
jgi:hypothetical protein